MDLDWLIQDLKIQSSVYDSTDDAKKVKGIKKCIELLERGSNVYMLPKIMNFHSIYHAPKPVVKAVKSVNVAIQNSASNGISFGNMNGMISPTQSSAQILQTGSAVPQPIVVCSPNPTPVAAALDPSALWGYSNNNPNPGHEIFALWKDANDDTRFCIYTWQEEDNPEELYAYAAGWDADFEVAGCEKYMPCKKVQHDKFMVVCTNQCCEQK